MKPLKVNEVADLISDHNLFVSTNGAKGNKIKIEDCLLEDVKFEYGKFESIIFSKSRFVCCSFSELDLYDAVLSYSVFEDCKFKECMMSMANMYSARFSNTIFINCNLIKNESINSIIENCVFYKCNLKLFDISNATVRNTKFIENDFVENSMSLHKSNGNIIW